jgi:chaperonin GroES
MGLEEAFETYMPIQDYVAIKRIAAEKLSKGGIIIPDTAGEAARPYEGIVLAIGPGRFDGKGNRSSPPPELKKGDHVCFGKYAGGESALMSEDFWLVRWDLLDAIIDP